MGSKWAANGERPKWSLIVITAVLTALGTSLASTWLPGLIGHWYEKITNQPIVIVEVKRGQQPVSGVKITATDLIEASAVVIGVASTDDKGIARLRLERPAALVFIHASFSEPSFERIYEKTHSIESFPAHFPLEVVKDFRQARVVVTATVGSQPSAAVGSLKIQYDQSPLSSDRRMKARLEVDWLKSTPRPSFQANTTAGVVRLEDLLKEVGIELQVVWSNELPQHVMGPDGRFTNNELLTTMEQYRNEEQENIWHFYLILGGQFQHPGVLSVMFDSKLRRGGALFDVRQQLNDPQRALYTAIHSIGHMLNLPHPWQAYGDRLSVMTYPFRWGDKWSFDNPDVYRFDEVARQHILRSPERYVRPGGSAFLEYGTRQPWVIASRSG